MESSSPLRWRDHQTPSTDHGAHQVPRTNQRRPLNDQNPSFGHLRHSRQSLACQLLQLTCWQQFPKHLRASHYQQPPILDLLPVWLLEQGLLQRLTPPSLGAHDSTYRFALPIHWLLQDRLTTTNGRRLLHRPYVPTRSNVVQS